MAEENKALVRRWFEDLFNEGNPDVADEIIAPDHLGREAYRCPQSSDRGATHWHRL